MSGGGGSTSGTIDFPAHMKDIHKNWLGVDDGSNLLIPISDGYSINDLLNQAFLNNPYIGIDLTSPDASVTNIRDEIATIKSSIGNIDSKTDWKSFLQHADDVIKDSSILKDIDITTILEKSRTSANFSTQQAVEAALIMVNSDVLDKARKAFENRADRSRIRSINRFSGSMSDINAVNGSAFILGMALIETQHIESINEFDTNLSTEMYRQGIQTFAQVFTSELNAQVQSKIDDKRYNASIIAQSVQSMTSVMLKKVEFEQAILSVLYETERFNVVATQEYETSDADIDAKYAEWELNNYMKAANVLASISGASSVLPEKPSRVASTLGGALGGASAGANAGTPGLVAGTLIGGLAGYLN